MEVLCDCCEWNGCSGHGVQKSESDAACPSIDEFSNTWPSLLELPYASACDSSFTPMSSSLIGTENTMNSPNECSSVLMDNYNMINEFSPSIKIHNVVGASTVVPLNSNNVPQCNNNQPSFFPTENGSNFPEVNIFISWNYMPFRLHNKCFVTMLDMVYCWSICRSVPALSIPYSMKAMISVKALILMLR